VLAVQPEVYQLLRLLPNFQQLHPVRAFA
jgi:hypothetical protein